MPIGVIKACRWRAYLLAAAHRLEVEAAADCGMQRTPVNPRHTADCLKGGDMLCTENVDAACHCFATTRRWPVQLSGDEIFYIQHRLCAAQAILDIMTTHRDGNVAALQATIPDGDDEPALVQWLLINVWRVFGDAYFDGVVIEWQQLLPPGELARIETENSPLSDQR